MTTLEIRKLVAKRTDIRILLDPRPLRATIRDVTVGKEGAKDGDLVSMSSFIYWDNTSSQGYCSEMMTVTTPEGEKKLSEAEQMSANLPMSSVVISDEHVVYGDGEKLLTEHGLEFPEEIEEGGDGDGEGGGEDGGGDGGGAKGGDDPGGGGGGGITEPPELSFNASTGSPSAIKGAFSDVNSIIDQKKMNLRDSYDISSSDIVVEVASIEIELEGDQVWERAWFISNKLKDLDTIGEATSIMFDYVAERPESSGSFFEAGFEGSVEEFANHFGTNHIPESFISTDGEADGEAVLMVDTGSLDNKSREATLKLVQEALENLGGINNLELVIKGTVKEASEQSEEVSA
jgi:hypothetical protein